ncbi:MAG: hypothetical protein HY849_07630 [Nitrosomonadales bacterium]|nr:hypothetical protein [Nitrosomonadales bacterium]
MLLGKRDLSDANQKATDGKQQLVGNTAQATYLTATTDELGIMLEERFAALVVLNRTGAPRRERGGRILCK